MKVDVKWETRITYERDVEIDDEAFKASGLDLESYVAENIDELVADLEEDYEDLKLTAQVEERELVEVDGPGYEMEDDE